MVSSRRHLRTALNGNNGSWTNTDDHNPGKGKNNGGGGNKGNSFLAPAAVYKGTGGKSKSGGPPLPPIGASNQKNPEHPHNRADPSAYFLEGNYYRNLVEEESDSLLVNSDGDILQPTEVVKNARKIMKGVRVKKSYVTELDHLHMVRDYESHAININQNVELHKLAIEERKYALERKKIVDNANGIDDKATAHQRAMEMERLRSNLQGDANDSTYMANRLLEKIKGDNALSAIKEKNVADMNLENMKQEGLIRLAYTQGENLHKVESAKITGQIEMNEKKSSSDQAVATIKSEGDQAVARIKADGEVETAHVKIIGDAYRSSNSEVAMFAKIEEFSDDLDGLSVDDRLKKIRERMEYMQNGAKPEKLKFENTKIKMWKVFECDQTPFIPFMYGRSRTAAVLTHSQIGLVPPNCLVRTVPFMSGSNSGLMEAYYQTADGRVVREDIVHTDYSMFDPISENSAYELEHVGVEGDKYVRKYNRKTYRNRFIKSSLTRWTHPDHDFIHGCYVYPIPYGTEITTENQKFVFAALEKVQLYHKAPDTRTTFQWCVGNLLSYCYKPVSDEMHRPIADYYSMFADEMSPESRNLHANYTLLGLPIGDLTAYLHGSRHFADVCKFTHTRDVLISMEIAKSLMFSYDEKGTPNSAFDNRFDSISRAYAALCQQALTRFGKWFSRELLENTCMYLAQRCAERAFLINEISGDSNQINRGEQILKSGGLT